MKAYISLGSNLGDRMLYIRKALDLLSPYVKAVSPVIETAPVDMPAGASRFLNAVAELDTDLPPDKLLDLLESVEEKLGRSGKGKCQSRTIDLDILQYEDVEQTTPRLTIPHHKLKKREFLCRLLKKLKKEKVKAN